MACRKGNAALRITPGRQQFYTNLAKLCAVEIDAASQVGAASLDECAEAIITWFAETRDENYKSKLERLSNLSESALRSFIHLGLQFERQLGGVAEKDVIKVLLDALRRES